MIATVADDAAVAVPVMRQGGRAAQAWAWRHERGAELLLTCDAAPEPGAEPWVAVVVRPDGTLLASANTTAMSGLYWSLDDVEGVPTLRFAVNPGAIVRSRRQVTTLDEGYIRQFLLQTPPDHWRTPYSQIDRVPTGTTLIWKPGSAIATAIEWCGPQSWEVPNLAGVEAAEEYLRIFDATVDALVPEQGSLSATISSGLDSTFMVASLARHASPERPVHAYCHAPHPDAVCFESPGRRADEYELARHMERAYPDRVVVHKVVNESKVAPLDAAYEVAVQSWLPVRNVGNFVWLSEIMRRAADLGAQRLFSGLFGNASFSYDHRYAAEYHLRRGHLIKHVVAANKAGSGRTWRSSAGVLKRLVRPVEPPGRLVSQYATVYGVRDLPAPKPQPDDRATFEQMLARRIASGGSLSTTGWPVQPVDPFTAADLVSLAARIEPVEWVKGERSRGFARRLGAGRVPDAIRLNTTKGIQSADVWFAMSDRSTEYFDRTADLESLPVLGDWVDVDVLRRTLQSWPWGRPESPPQLELVFVNRLLAIADFVRLSLDRLPG